MNYWETLAARPQIGMRFAGQLRVMDVRSLEGGERGGGEHRGEPGTAEYAPGVYPACSKHGAMNRLGKDKSIWRCLATGCNCGLELVA